MLSFLSRNPHSLDLVFTGQEMTWLEARRFTEAQGGLPPHILLDYAINGTHLNHPRRGFSVWAKELLVYLNPGQRFTGSDIVDSSSRVYQAIDMRSWIIPAKYVPIQAQIEQAAGLFVIPGEIQERPGEVIIIPAKVIVLANFLYDRPDGVFADGSVHGIPTATVAAEKDVRLSHRRLDLAKNGEFAYIRPLCRMVGVNGRNDATNRDMVCAAARLGAKAEVAYVKTC
jgi:hypothetical protein